MKDLEIGNMCFTSNNKIKITTQEFMLMNYDKGDYKPFLRENGIYLPIKYTSIVTCQNFNKVITTEFENGKEVISNEFKTPGFKTISFFIEEL